MTENEIAKQIMDTAYKVHTTLGPGLLESVCESVLCYEFDKRGLQYERQVVIPIVYEDIQLNEGFRADIIVENKVIIEIKSVTELAPVHYKQLLTYLRLTDMRLGMLINFNLFLIKDGVRRIVNNLEE